MQRFPGGLVVKALRLLYHSTLGLRVIKKKKKVSAGCIRRPRQQRLPEQPANSPHDDQVVDHIFILAVTVLHVPYSQDSGSEPRFSKNRDAERAVGFAWAGFSRDNNAFPSSLPTPHTTTNPSIFRPHIYPTWILTPTTSSPQLTC